MNDRVVHLDLTTAEYRVLYHALCSRSELLFEYAEVHGNGALDGVNAERQALGSLINHLSQPAVAS